MTVAQLRAACETALGDVDFEPPVSVAYCTAVRERILALAPGISVDVMHRFREVQVDVRDGGSVVVLVLPAT